MCENCATFHEKTKRRHANDAKQAACPHKSACWLEQAKIFVGLQLKKCLQKESEPYRALVSKLFSMNKAKLDLRHGYELDLVRFGPV